ncbi:MAG TPA: GC-type dockerin domain-anchored protein [Phycisphaerales bacterium]|nr:GC-type dockerin domain-anchored protein [Phycisphaerales bacterium]
MPCARLLSAVVLVFPVWASAQCDPAWDASPGVVGLGDGYAEAATPWDDGTGEALYVGGSFTKIGGINGLRGIARWNPDTGAYSKLGAGLSFGNTNGFVTSIEPFDTGTERLLVVGGFFASAGGVSDTQSLAAWNGSAWRSLGAGFVAPEAVWGMVTGDFGDGLRLFLCGGFTTIAGQPASGVASWDGTSLSVVGEGTGMTGFSPFVNEMVLWDDGSGLALYAVGRFSSIDGVNAALAARYRPGTGWERIGNGLIAPQQTTTLDAAVLFDDGTGTALYIAGSPFRPSGQSGNVSVCKWDGTAWSKVGQDVGGRVTDLRVWDDGTGPALYLSGTATPDINYFARLAGGQWQTYLGGVAGPAVPPSNFPSVFGLGEFRGDLVVCGNFGTTGDGQSAAGIAFIAGCASACPADFNGDTVVNSLDFIAFLNAYTDGDPKADFNGDTVINSLDFIAYLNAYVAGCP